MCIAINDAVPQGLVNNAASTLDQLGKYTKACRLVKSDGTQDLPFNDFKEINIPVLEARKLQVVLNQMASALEKLPAGTS